MLAMSAGVRAARAPNPRMAVLGRRPFAARWCGSTMSRVIAFVACGFTLAACSASFPSLTFLRSAPPTEMLRVESNPPGADVRTSQGQNCRTPCELSVQVSELTVTVALDGYETQTIAVRPDAETEVDPDSPPRGGKLAPNPVYAELPAIAPPAMTKKKPAKKKKRIAPVAAAEAPPPATATPVIVAPAPAPETPAASTAYPWPSR